MICLVDSFNGRDPSRLLGAPSTSWLSEATKTLVEVAFPDGDPPSSRDSQDTELGEILGNSRSVMLLNVLGYTRTTMAK